MEFGDKKNVDDFKFFMAAYSLLDMIGYKSKSSNVMNRMNTDAQHAYFAAFCDYFITQDTHLTSKAMALYEEFGISTRILTPQNAITELYEGRNDALVLEFELAFDHYSYFISYDEAAIMVDTVADYPGCPSKEDYQKARESIVAGDTGASINWQGNGILLTLRADPERHRPELFVTLTSHNA